MTIGAIVKLFLALLIGGIATLPLVSLGHLISATATKEHPFWYLVQLGADAMLPLVAIFMVLAMITGDPWGEPRG